jgi:NitT/TauT family transport system substrate-binding protein
MRLQMGRRAFSCIVLSAFVAAACGGSAPAVTSSSAPAGTGSAATQTPVVSLGKVTLGVGAHVVSGWPLTIAEGAGLLKAEGMEAEVIVTNGGANTLAAVAGGSVHFGVLPYGDAILATQKGQPLVSVAALTNQYTTDAVINTAKATALGITATMPLAERVKRAKGIKIAINAPGSGQDKVVRYVLKQNGLDPDKDVTIVGVGNDGLLPAFLAGQVDAYLTSSPTTDQGIAAGGSWWFRPSQGEIAELNGFIYTTLIARPDYLKANPKMAEAVVRAITKALTILRTDEARSLTVLANYVKIAPDLLKASLRSNVAGYPKDAIITEAGFKQNVDFLAQFGQPITLKFDDVTTNEYAKKAATP